jgi:ribosome biogenesis GTPase
MRALAHLGWDAHLDSLFLTHHGGARGGAVPGRVIRVDRGSCLVAVPGAELRVPFAGRLRGEQPQGGITAGDWVVVESDLISAVLPRRTVLLRKLANDVSGAQAVAANLDVGMVVAPLGAGVNARRVERTVAQVWASGARPVVVLTKADLSDDLDRDLDAAAEAGAGAELTAVSAVTGEGVEALRSLLQPGRTGALLGPSGAGKSTLVNLLCGQDLLATAAVRDDGRGRHTTTHRQLVILPGGALLVDTPGMRELGMWDAEEGIAEAFADIAELATRCRFRDCAHQREPGCAVRAAARQDAAVAARLESHRKLEREQRRTDARLDGYLRAQRHRDLRAFARSLRARPDKRDAR